jgi:hypothetical protein
VVDMMSRKIISDFIPDPPASRTNAGVRNDTSCSFTA